MPDIVWNPTSNQTAFTTIQRAYLFYGEDDHQKDEALAELANAAIDPAFEDFDLELIDARSSTPDAMFAAVSIVPFGSRVRLVVVKGAEIYRKREKQAEADRLAQIISSIGPGGCLALRAGAEDEGSRGKTVLTPKLDAALRKVGDLFRCRQLTQEALQDWLIAEARRAEKRLDPEAAGRIIQIGFEDRRALRNELEKAICFVGESKNIGVDDVEAVCSYNAEDVMFKLVDSISQRNPDRSMTLFHEILRFDNKPQAVAGRFLALLARQLRILWQATELMKMRIEPGALRNPPQELIEQLPAEGSITSMAWKAGEIFRTARGWTGAQLVKAFDLVLECDVNNKGGGEGSENVVTNLEMLIVKLCGAN
jgi:DNA polymerase-3 subunit delta